MKSPSIIRSFLLRLQNLVVGDVILGRTSKAYIVFMYLGDAGFVNLSEGIVTDTADPSSRVERLLANMYYYAIVRPSYALEAEQT
jgi:hypothetical protein